MKVQLIQPLVPDYCAALFNALAGLPGWELRVDASEAWPGDPSLKPTRQQPRYLYRTHVCRGVRGDRLTWQQDLRLDRDLTPGDVLVLCGNPRMLSNYPLLVGAVRRCIGVVWWGHGWTHGASQITAGIRRMIMKAADVILLYTDQEVADYKRRGFAPERLFALNNAIDQGPIREAIRAWDTKRLADFQAERGLGETPVILFCSRLSRKTRLECLLDAAHRLQQKRSEVTLVIIGEGPEQERLQRYSQTLGLAERVRWLGAIYDQTELAPWFLSSTAFVYPGAIGLSIFQAFGYGLPVIIHNNLSNQMPEAAALRDGENGYLFRESDAEDLAEKILLLCENPATRSSMSLAARKSVDEVYTLENMVDRFECAVNAAGAIGLQRHRSRSFA